MAAPARTVLRFPSALTVATPVATRTFDIAQRPGAFFELGPCPDCVKVTLGGVKSEAGHLFQRFDVTGGVLSFLREDIPVPGTNRRQFKYGTNDEVVFRNAPGRLFLDPRKQPDTLFIDLATVQGAEIELLTRKYALKFRLVEAIDRALRVVVEVRGS